VAAEETTEPHEVTRRDVEAYMEKWWLDFREPDVEDHSAEDHGMDEVLRNVGLMWEQEQKSHVSAGELEGLCNAYEDIVSRFEEFIIILYDKLRRFKHDLDDDLDGDDTTLSLLSVTFSSTESSLTSSVQTEEIFKTILDDPYDMFRAFCTKRHRVLGLLERLWSLQQAESPFGHTGNIKGSDPRQLSRWRQEYDEIFPKLGLLLDSPHFWESLEKKWDPRLATESSVMKVVQWQEQVDHDLCYRSSSSEGRPVPGDMPDDDDRRSEDSFVRPESPTHRSEQADMEDVLELNDILLPHGFGGIF
jgi:hypothetical protein